MHTVYSLQKSVLLLLAFIGGLIAARYLYTGEHRFFFLVWNLFLAWLPFTISILFEKLNRAVWWKQAALFAAWLLFFPNTLYVVTDLIHLKETGKAPLWYDAVLLFGAAVAGLILGFISLVKAELFLMTRFSRKITERITVALLFLGSFGVYLGRFLRWNSWDIVQDPVVLLFQIAHRVVYPLQHIRTWGTTFLLFTFFGLLWFFIKKMPGYLTGHHYNKLQ
jgi:uncharacterized membrane protein